MQIFFWVLAISLSLVVGYWVYLADRKRAVPYPWLTALLRVLVILSTSFLLLAPSITIEKHETHKPILVFLQDNSASIPVALKADSNKYKADANELFENLSGDYEVVKWGFGNSIQHDTLFQYRQQATDISSALMHATEFYGQQNLGGIILATDGKFNQGINPEFLELPYSGSVYTAALGDSATQKDIRVSKVYANKTVSLNSQFEIRADIIARMCNGYNSNIQLREVNGNATGSASVNIRSDRFDRTVSLTIRADRPGLHHYIVSAPPADGELNTANNKMDVFVEVISEKKNILIAANAPHPDINAIRESLSGIEGYNITVRTGENLPSSFANYHVVILHSLPSQIYPVRQLTDIRKPVWFIMGAGADNAAFNRFQDIVQLNVNTFNLQNLFAAYNPSFSAFTLPQDINAVMDKMPPLAVPAGTISASPNTLVLLHEKNNRQPLWMMSQGANPYAMLVGEGLWRWRLFEYKHFTTHSTIDELIRQTVSFLAANVNERPFRVELPKYVWSDQEAISMNAYLLNQNNEQVNTSEVQLVISDSAGNKQEFSLERAGNAYSLNIGLRSEGTYTYNARTVYNGNTYAATGSFAVKSIPLELMETGADYPLLYRLSQKYDGAMVPGNRITSLVDTIRNNKNIKPVIQTTTESIPLVDWKWYFFLVLLFAAAEWLLRKYWLAQ